VKTIEIEKLPLEVQPDLLTQTQALVQPVTVDQGPAGYFDGH